VPAILRSDKNGVATLTMNRPTRLNALGNDTFAELAELLDALTVDDSVVAVVITGQGDAFCSGRDIDELGSEDPLRHFRWFLRQQHDQMDHLEALEKPTIAAINGVCVGGGLELAICCDFRIASRDPAVRIGYPENRIGLIPASGAVSRMQNIVGPAWTKEMVLTGRFIDADEAREIGLVTRVADDNEDLLKQAQELGESFNPKSKEALGLGKVATDLCANTDVTSGRIIERLVQSLLLHQPDHAEGMASFREKRPPDFSN
jgi:enoyl-CoA hydratase/carnithine racemase